MAVNNLTKDERYMKEALRLAFEAADNGEVPVGAIVVCGDRIVGKGFNRCESRKSVLCHAELEAINEACRSMGGWRLEQCELYVTLEPCPMCAGAAINSRLKRVIYGADDKISGSCRSISELFSLPYPHTPELSAGVLEAECSRILSDFFSRLRANGSNARTGLFIAPEGVLWSGASLFPNAKEVLGELADKYCLCLVSSLPADNLSELIDNYEISPFFCGFESTYRTGLSMQDSIRLLMRRTGIKRAFFLGCSEEDRVCSECAGLSFLHAAYSGKKTKKPRPSIQSLTELPAQIEGLTEQWKK